MYGPVFTWCHEWDMEFCSLNKQLQMKAKYTSKELYRNGNFCKETLINKVIAAPT